MSQLPRIVRNSCFQGVMIGWITFNEVLALRQLYYDRMVFFERIPLDPIWVFATMQASAVPRSILWFEGKDGFGLVGALTIEIGDSLWITQK